MSLNIKALDELKAKIDNAKMKFDYAQDKSKEKIDDAIKESKSRINVARQNYEMWIKDKEGDIFSESLKMKMTLESKFSELKTTINEKKFEHEKHKKHAIMEKTKEHAEHAASFAIWSIEEAILAYLEANAAEVDYMESYGNNENK